MKEPKIAAKQPSMQSLEPGSYFWCACGKSSNQPFCDGSHQGTDFTPVQFKIDEKQDVWLCQCKHSSNKPFCDGSHKDL
jgi:CDGSH-type Zn-finger protein